MHTQRSLWLATRLPLCLLAVAGVAIAVATILDRTSAREWALTIGAPALTVVLPVGLVWLAMAVIAHVVRRKRAASDN